MATLNYRLPLSRIRFSGTKSTTTDSILGASISRDATAQLAVGADPHGPLSLDLQPGLLQDSDAKFSLTEDGRLTGASISVTGQGAAIVAGVVGIATTVLGVGIRAASGRMIGTFLAASEGGISEPVLTPSERVEAAYEHDRGDASRRRKDAMATLAALRAAQQRALAKLAEGSASDAAGTGRLIARLAAAIILAEADVDRENATMKLWRDGTIETSAVEYVLDVTLDEFRASDVAVRDGAVTFPRPSGDSQQVAQDKVRAVWENLGCLVVVKDDPDDVEVPAPVVGKYDPRHLVVRVPRPVILQFYERSTDDRAILVREEPALVVDGASHERAMALDGGIFGKHSRGLTFSSEGILTGLDHGSSSELAGGLGAIAAIPGGISGALENAEKIAASYDKLRSGQEEAALQRAKRQFETRTHELDLEGLEKTSKDYAELALLKQQAAMKEQRAIAFPPATTPDPVAQEIAALRQQYQLNTLRHLVDDAT